MKNDTHIGKVYFKENEGVHHYGFVHKEDQKAVKGFTNRTRVAYLIVSDEESNTLNNDDEDKKLILENIKNKYQEHLIKAVKEESKKNNRNITSYELKGLDEKVIEKKLVKLSTLQLHTSKSYGSILKAKEYTHAYNEKLDEKHKKNTEEKTSGILDFSKNKSQEILNKEKNKLKEEEQSYIIVSMPYVYNIKKDSQIEELELEYYENRVSASFMPELIVEYGVFFDGTNNNIHNIDFYKNFTEFLKEPAEYIKENKERKFPRKPNIYDYKTIQELIVSEPNPKLNNEVVKLIINQIDTAEKEIRYFDKESNLNLEDEVILESLKANHSSKVFEYLIDVKNGKKSIKKEDRADFVREEILVDKDEDSSYTNGESNISRLYNLYNGNDVKRNKEALSPTRFKLYESGAGTNNPFIKEAYGEDNKLGSGLALADTGIKAHIIYSCIKIFEQLKTSSINHIDELVLDVFGFSRGAATARHFVNTILKDSEIIENGNKKYSIKIKDGKNIFSSFFENGYVTINGNKIFNPLNTKNRTYNHGRNIIGNPYYGQTEIKIDSLSFRFIGIYDTVPHYGFKQANDSKNLNLDFHKNKEKLGQVVHLMADDEYRYNFDAFSIFTDKNKDFHKVEGGNPSGGKKFEEYYIPGAHSDVGGGYNVEEELILLAQRRISDFDISSVKSKIEAWNKKYNWLEEAIIKEVNSKKDIPKNKDGFYYYINQEYRTNYSVNTLYVYMYKKEISNKYEHVSLRLMHDRALYKDMTRTLNYENLKDDFERVPLGSLDNYKFHKDETLDKVYNILKEKKELNTSNIELYKELKNTYLHHSSKQSFINKPSYEDKEGNDFYGKRVIYSASGDKFTRN